MASNADMGEGYQYLEPDEPASRRIPNRKTKRKFDDLPEAFPARELPDLDLQIGDGDWLSGVLTNTSDRLVVGTKPVWEVAFLTYLVSSILVAMVSFVVFVLTFQIEAMGTLLALVVTLAFAIPILGFRIGWRLKVDLEQCVVEFRRAFGFRRDYCDTDDVGSIVIGVAEQSREIIVANLFHDRRDRWMFDVPCGRSDAPGSSFMVRVGIEIGQRLRCRLRPNFNPDETNDELIELENCLFKPKRVEGWLDEWRTVKHRRFLHPMMFLGAVGFIFFVALLGSIFNSPGRGMQFAAGAFAGCNVILLGLGILQTQRGMLSRQSDPGIFHTESGAMICAIIAVGIGTSMCFSSAGVLFKKPDEHGFGRKNHVNAPTRIEFEIDHAGKRHVKLEYSGREKDDACFELLAKHKDTPEFRERLLNELYHANISAKYHADGRRYAIQFLLDENIKTRRYAMRLLEKCGQEEDVETLGALSNDPNREIRDQASSCVKGLQERLAKAKENR